VTESELEAKKMLPVPSVRKKSAACAERGKTDKILQVSPHYSGLGKFENRGIKRFPSAKHRKI